MHKKNNINKSQNFIQGLRPFSASLPHSLKKIMKKSGYNFSNIVDNWTKLVGEDTSSYCYPYKVKINKDLNNGTLILNVEHGKEIEVEYKKNEIIDKLNGFFGQNYITQINLKIIDSKIKKNKNSEREKKLLFKKNLENLKNKDLKHSLDKLIKAFNDKHN
tara:strand:+ start:43 stop:525 length:483 start_codon:yes stop_codon:yes gene_type:complete